MGRGVRSSARLSGGGSGGCEVRQPRAAAARSSAAAAAARAAAAERRARAAERAREVEDSPQVLREKCRRLARAVRDAKHLVVYTGAGISTAADIPDYRGPDGVWTRLQRGETVGRVEVSHARPTLTHMALSALWARGALKFVVSQNCDGLHVRAGLPRRALAELHGDMFCERCARCGRVLLRAFDTTERTRRHAHATRRLCPACGHELRDSIVHFGERGRAAWPLNWAGALRHAAAADVVLCLGSSLKVLRRYPRLWQMQRAPHARPALYIVNLQWTPKDAAAALKINARCDAVMAAVARRLRLRVPRYAARRDPLLAHAVPLAPAERHTTRAPPLPPPSPSLSDSDDERCYSLGEPSASDSDEPDDPDDELPLRHLADRLRAPAQDTRNHFKAFQVSMRSCEATILLRAEHAPSELPPPEPPPSPFHFVSPSSLPVAPASSISFVQRPAPTSDLRRFRIRRPLASNGQLVCGPALAPEINSNVLGDLLSVKQENKTNGNGAWPCSSKLRQLLELNPKDEDVKSEINHTSGVIKIESNGVTRGEFGVDKKCKVQLPIEGWRDSSDLKAEAKVSCKSVVPYSPQASSVDRRCKVQLPVTNWRDSSEFKSEIKGPCRSMVPGEQEVKVYRSACKVQLPVTEWSSTVAVAGAAAEQEARARRECEALAALFTRRAVLACRASLYPGLHTILAGACAWCARHFAARRCLWYGPPPDAAAPRVYRVVRGRRYLCACCPDSSSAPLTDDAGWYGKGYRKGRRRRKP